MEQTSEANSKSWKRQLVIAKLLLRNYGILHEFHVRQIECYLVGCCQTSLDGVVEIDADNKVVSYKIFTSRFFEKKGDKIAPKKEWVKKMSHLFGKKQYEEEVAFANINLKTWTKELLWGDETKVKVMIDGRQIEQ